MANQHVHLSVLFRVVYRLTDAERKQIGEANFASGTDLYQHETGQYFVTPLKGVGYGQGLD